MGLNVPKYRTFDLKKSGMDYPVTIKTKSIGGMTEEEFFKFCQENDTLKMERNAYGEIIIMAPTGSETGGQNMSISGELYLWTKEEKLGYSFDSNTGFTLPNGAIRSADSSYITKQRWENIPKNDRKGFAHICPDFVIELLSDSDSAKVLQDKMKEWMDNGCALAWMINPDKRETWVYRKNGEVEVKLFNRTLSGEDILPGFSLNLESIFTI